jgi:molybdopterin-guanine dinucleotide biosynthesis protein A
VFCVGGDLGALAELGLDAVADDDPHQGPLFGVRTGLREASRRGAGMMVVAACDHPDLDGSTVRALLGALTKAGPGVVWASPVDDKGFVPLIAALRVEAACIAVDALVATGLASMRRFRDDVAGVLVPDLLARALRDVDRPGDLPER